MREAGGIGAGASMPVARMGISLSPRVRGNRHQRVGVDRVEGSIPACAGEPPPSGSVWVASRVYPRVCGGTPGVNGAFRPAEGLSPRVRGNQQRSQAPAPRRGSIPACAGEPGTRLFSFGEIGVYPRVCGGTSSAWLICCSRLGLSPRVRGNRRRRRPRGRRGGSIPACAGEPRAHLGSARSAGVYPRVCGGTPESRQQPQ